MTPEVLARASEPFFTTRPGSAGLGLAQVHGFARRVGGAVTLYGAPGQGATANLYVPAVEVEAEPWPRSSSGMAAQG
jgi:signal transduction histidine kinase